MRKFTLLLFVLAVGTMSYGQRLTQKAAVPFMDDPVRTQVSGNELKGSGEVFWSTSFNWGDVNTKTWSLPAGWEIKDLAELGNYWMWRSPYDTLGGCCTKQGPSPNFKTPLDGFICVPADEYNRRDGIGTSNGMNTYITTPVINCSSKTSVTVKFKQLFRLCCGTTVMTLSVTNDGGVHWAAYDCQFGVGNNRVSDARYQNVEFNISDVAAGMANVQIRFSMSGNSHYFWMIDDLELAEAYQNDLVLEDYWSAFNGGYDTRIGHINYWPLSQMGMASQVAGNIGDYEFTGALLNNGMADQENARLQMTVLRNGTEVFSDVSSSSTIWSLERDTATSATNFLASDYGDYQFKFTATSDNAEEVTANNTIKKMFTVNDTLFHRADFTAEAGMNTGGWVGGGNAGDMVGIFYDIYKPCEINSITAYISGVTIAETPSFQYLLKKDMGTDGYQEVILSDVIDATLEMRGTYVTLDMQKDGETEFLEPGLYIACVRFWGTKEGDADGTNGMSVGWDMENNFSGYTYQQQAVGGNEFTTGKTSMIGISINATGGPTLAPATFNVDMNKHIASGEFKPATDFVDISGSFNNWGSSAHFTDPDGDGVYSLVYESLPVGKVIEYKYRINGNWNTSEYPNGGPNRKYTVRYWNIINNTYNGGVTAGVDNNNLISTFNVYPNPTQGAFKVEITNANGSDMQISLTNIQGQVVYQNVVKNAVNHTETIDSDLAKGLYFLSVKTGNDVKVQKVIIQ